MAITNIYSNKHYHVNKKFVDISFVSHPDTLFQPNDIFIASFYPMHTTFYVIYIYKNL